MMTGFMHLMKVRKRFYWLVIKCIDSFFKCTKLGKRFGVDTRSSIQCSALFDIQVKNIATRTAPGDLRRHGNTQ